MTELVVASRKKSEKIKRRGFDGVLSIAAPGAEALRFYRAPAPAHLVLRMDDIVAPERRGVLPTLEMVSEGLTFARRFADGRLLIQCEAGVSRSGAFAVAVIADRLGAGREHEALEAALALAPDIIPNLLSVGRAVPRASFSPRVPSSPRPRRQVRCDIGARQIREADVGGEKDARQG